MRSYAGVVPLWRYAAETLLNLRLFGVILASVFFWQSLEPSLLPRTWMVQGLVSGICAVTGYFLAYLIERGLWHLHVRPDIPDRFEVPIRRALFVAAAIITVLAFAESFTDQEWTWDTLGVEPEARWQYALVLPITIAICAFVAALVRAFRFVRRNLEKGGHKVRLPHRIAVALSLALTLVLLVVVVDDVVFNNVIKVSNSVFATSDLSVDRDEPEPPTSALKSGGPGSPIGWSDLGFRGREFVSAAPSAEQIDDFTDDAIEPIRVYVGKKSASTAARRAQLAVDELERTGGFHRKTVVINTPTGTGWMDEQIYQPLEYLYGGDTAVIGMQYSHLPSHLGFLTEQDSAVISAKALFTAVRSRLDEMKPSERPFLIVTGESLGAYGGQGVFKDFTDLTNQVDYALWLGTPEFTTLRRQAERDRLPGSRQLLPVLSAHPDVVFTETGDGVNVGDSVVYLQNADDPIVWWSPRLIISRPDWMKERRSPQINPQMSWTPFTTFFQISTDMIASNSFDEGIGHIYGSAPLTVWTDLIRPPGWDEDKIERLRDRMDAIIRI